MGGTVLRVDGWDSLPCGRMSQICEINLQSANEAAAFVFLRFAAFQPVKMHQ